MRASVVGHRFWPNAAAVFLAVIFWVSGPLDAKAQLPCPAGGGDDGSSVTIPTLSQESALGCRNSVAGGTRDYDNAATQAIGAGPTNGWRFLMWLPDRAPGPGSAAIRPVKVIFLPTGFDSRLTISSVSCSHPSAVIGGVGSTVATIGLDDGASCLLSVGADSDNVGYSGGTLSRTGSVYSISAGQLSGGSFGGIFPLASGNSGDGASISRTSSVISNFMRRQTDQIASNEPDLASRLGDNNRSANSPISLTGQGTESNSNVAVATGLSDIVRSQQLKKQRRRRELSPKLALSSKNNLGSPTPPPPGFDVWLKGTWSRLDNDTAATDFGLLSVGADYRYRPGLVVGLLTQFDMANETDKTDKFSIDGNGWMAGPYVVAHLHQNLVFDFRAASGMSYNNISPFNTHTDSFGGARWLVKGQLTGDFRLKSLHLAPHVAMIYSGQEQKAYTDSNGTEIGAQTVEFGHLTFGPKVSTTVTLKDGTSIAPFAAIKGIWDFRRLEFFNGTDGPESTGKDELRGRTEAGLSVNLPDGISFTGEGFFDGIDINKYQAYGGSVKVNVPF